MFLRENLYRYAIEYLQPVRAKCGANFSPPLGKRLNIVEKLEGLSLADASFAPGDSSCPLKKKW